MISSRMLLTAAALAVTAGAASAQSAPRPEDARDEVAVRLNVMTFNIRTSAIDDREDAWPLRRNLVVETIRLHDPDVLGLQEALAEQIDFLEKALPEYRWLGVDRGLNGGTGLSEATPIFYKHRNMAPIESGTFWLGNPPSPGTFGGRGAPAGRGGQAGPAGRGSAGGGRGGSRIVTWARFHHFASGLQIHVYNTHLSPREGEQHIVAAERINERVAALPPESAVIVMGDFNAYAGSSETWRVATSRGLRDAWDHASERSGPTVTSNGFGPPPDWGGARIDWILVGGPIDVSRAETVVHDVDGRYPSDHYPVVATLRVRPS
jgi:endonuclease/exonuclease/phosphatase family metal-dependent hydrolase